MLSTILPLLPRHETWLEAFAGAAWVTLAKPPAAVETLNDLDDGVINFYRVIRDREMCERLQAALDLTSYARAEMLDCRARWQDQSDPVEKARMWFVLARQCFNGNPAAGGWAHTMRAGHSRTKPWLAAIHGLQALHDRLRSVQIERQDWRPLLRTYNQPHCLLYADPPYILSTRRGGARYSHELSDEDHRELVEALLAWRGHALVSGYAHPIYAPLEAAGWRRIETEVTAASDSGTRRMESLWLNYDPAELRGQQSLFGWTGVLP